MMIEGQQKYRIVTFAGRIISILGFLYLLYVLYVNFKQIISHEFTCANLIVFTLSVGLCVTSFVLNAIITLNVLRDLDFKVTLSQSLVMVGISQVGKYLPGNVMQYFGRVAAAKKYGIDTRNIITCIGIETFVAILAVLICIFLSVVSDSRSISVVNLSLNLNLDSRDVFICIFIVFVLLLFVVKNILHNQMLVVTVGSIAKLLFLSVLNYLLYGCVLFVMSLTLFTDTGGLFYIMLLVFCMAWLVGFIVPGAPGGIGVREAIIVIALKGVLGLANSVFLAMVLRFVTTSGDVLSFCIAWAINRNHPPKLNLDR